ncbi:MAG: cysteine peptidase family C39 domain-containing protein, partial [Actinomycetes bacterium]
MAAAGSTSPMKALPPPIPDRKRRRVPTIIQMEAVECGPACLAMVLAHYGKYVPLDVLRDECNISRDGTTALRLAEVARKYGLDARGFKADLPQLEELPTPFIAFWKFNHFVVVEGWNDKGVFLNDPATGPRLVSWAQTDKDFTGIAVKFSVTESFEPGGRKPSVLRRMPQLLRGYAWPLAFATLVGLFGAIPGIAAAGFLSFFINRILNDGQTSLLGGFFVALAVALVAQVGLSWIQMRTLTETTTSLSTNMAATLAWRTLRLPMRYYTQRSSGEVAWRMNMPDAIAAQLSGPLPAAVASAVSAILYFVAMALINLPVAVVALVIALLDFVVLRLIATRERDGQRLLLQDEGRLNGETAAGISGIEFVKATGAEDDLFSRFTGHHATMVNDRQSLGAVTQLLTTVPPFLRIIASGSAIGIGAFAVLNGSLSIGGLVALQPLMAGFLLPFATFVQLGSATNLIAASLTKIDDVLEQDTEVG